MRILVLARPAVPHWELRRIWEHLKEVDFEKKTHTANPGVEMEKRNLLATPTSRCVVSMRIMIYL